MSYKDRFLNWFSGETEIDGEDRNLQLLSSSDVRPGVNAVRGPSASGPKVMVCKPASFDEAKMIADYLKSRKQVIVNFEDTEADTSQKIIDFISGAAYALDGHSRQLGTQVFLFAPLQVEIVDENRFTIV